MGLQLKRVVLVQRSAATWSHLCIHRVTREPSELSQWLCYDDSTINIVVVIIIIIIIIIITISDGFQQDSTTSDGLDPSALQKEERTSKSVMDFDSEKKIWICWV